MSLGDRAVGSILNFKFNVTNSSGVPTTLTGTPAIACYKNNSTAESTAGLTLTVDFDAKTGLCNITVDTSADSSFYAADSDFEIVLTAGTVGAVDVTGTVVGYFSLAKCTANADVKKIAGTTVPAMAGVLDVRLADAVAHGGTPGSSTATLALSQLVVTNPTGSAVVCHSTGGGGNGLQVIGDEQSGLAVSSGTTDAVVFFAGGNGRGLFLQGTGTGAGLGAVGGDPGDSSPGGNGASFIGGPSRHGMYLEGGDSGNGLRVTGGASSGTAVIFVGGSANGTGFSIRGTGTGTALEVLSLDGGTGVQLYGFGSSGALEIYGGSDVPAVSVHGPTTGDAISISAGAGNALLLAAAGVGKHDINLAGSGDILGNLTGTINGLTAAGLATLFTVDSTKLYADAVTGSPVKEIGNILNRVMTESYAVDGAAMTPAQALYEICQLLEERTISGTTLTIKKRDGVTTAFELTLDAVPPTTQTRSS